MGLLADIETFGLKGVDSLSDMTEHQRRFVRLARNQREILKKEQAKSNS